jgi:hypothetical protein
MASASALSRSSRRSWPLRRSSASTRADFTEERGNRRQQGGEGCNEICMVQWSPPSGNRIGGEHWSISLRFSRKRQSFCSIFVPRRNLGWNWPALLRWRNGSARTNAVVVFAGSLAVQDGALHLKLAKGPRKYVPPKRDPRLTAPPHLCELLRIIRCGIASPAALQDRNSPARPPRTFPSRCGAFPP